MKRRPNRREKNSKTILPNRVSSLTFTIHNLRLYEFLLCALGLSSILTIHFFFVSAAIVVAVTVAHRTIRCCCLIIIIQQLPITLPIHLLLLLFLNKKYISNWLPLYGISSRSKRFSCDTKQKIFFNLFFYIFVFIVFSIAYIIIIIII